MTSVVVLVIYETTLFTRQLRRLMTDHEYRALQEALILSPELGARIIGGGGIRKLRWTLSGRGKRGGVRVIYYWAPSDQQLFMLAIYEKPKQTDLTRRQIQALRRIVEAEFRDG